MFYHFNKFFVFNVSFQLIEKETAPGIVPQRSDGTIPTETLMALLYYLFPDANDNPVRFFLFFIFSGEKFDCIFFVADFGFKLP